MCGMTCDRLSVVSCLCSESGRSGAVGYDMYLVLGSSEKLTACPKGKSATPSYER